MMDPRPVKERLRAVIREAKDGLAQRARLCEIAVLEGEPIPVASLGWLAFAAACLVGECACVGAMAWGLARAALDGDARAASEAVRLAMPCVLLFFGFIFDGGGPDRDVGSDGCPGPRAAAKAKLARLRERRALRGASKEGAAKKKTRRL